MVTGQIVRLIKDRGFGFIKDESGQEYFFHFSALDPRNQVKFENLLEGNRVEFQFETGDKGPRAIARSMSVVSGV